MITTAYEIAKLAKTNQKITKRKLMSLKSGGLDIYSKMTLTSIIHLIGNDLWQEIIDQSPPGYDKTTARWILRGVPFDLAVLKSKIEFEFKNLKPEEIENDNSLNDVIFHQKPSNIEEKDYHYNKESDLFV